VKRFRPAWDAPNRRRLRRNAESDQRSARVASISSPRARTASPGSIFLRRNAMWCQPALASVGAVENGRVAHRYVAIVGDPEHPSPEIPLISRSSTSIRPGRCRRRSSEGNHSAHAGDPGTDARQDPVIDVRARRSIRSRSTGGTGAGPSIILCAGRSGQSPARIRIGMPNKLAVYMHNTPSKGAFG